MKVSGDWIKDARLKAALSAIAGGGHQALVVGGAVRNDLLGMPVDEVDIATDALPGHVAELAAAAGIRVVPTGIDHGTVTLVIKGAAYEVTTFRRDVETDGRRAVVAYSDRIEEDASRRDFTMNALYATAEGAIVDPLGGLADLVARRIRFVGEPRARIREDYLRILRFFRFQAWFGDPAEGPESEGLAAVAANSAGIDTLSRERVGHEMRKLLQAPDPAPAVGAMAMAGVLMRALPGADHAALAPLVVLEAALAPPAPADWRRRLAALGGEDPAAALRLSRDEARHLAALHRAISSAASAGELAWRLGVELGRDALLLRAALTGGHMPGDWAAAMARGAGARFPVKAADLPGLTGPAIGRRLAELERAWIASDFTLGRDALLG